MIYYLILNMDIEPILIEEHYEEALKRVEELWDAEPDTEEARLLLEYVKRIEEYENRHYPIDPYK